MNVIFLYCILSPTNLSLEGMQSWHTSSHITFFFYSPSQGSLILAYSICSLHFVR
jgi:hypothetical protein